MPKPKKGEEKNEYISRCIKHLMEKENKDQDQALAICYNYWDKANKTNQNEDSNYINLKSYLEMFSNIEMKNDVFLMESLVRQETINFEKPSQAKLLSYDQASNSNKMGRLQGLLVCDTVNHPVFPLYAALIDTSKFMLSRIKNEYQAVYTGMETMFLPWHFTIEMIEDSYYIFNTRPIDMRFPLTTNETQELIKKNDIELTKETKQFFKKKPFDLQDAIHICVIGDSSRDMYTKNLYEIIGRSCVGPIARYFRIPLRTYQGIWPLNIGNKFKMNLLDSNIRI